MGGRIGHALHKPWFSRPCSKVLEAHAQAHAKEAGRIHQQATKRLFQIWVEEALEEGGRKLHQWAN